jgi:hypothetical protein
MFEAQLLSQDKLRPIHRDNAIGFALATVTRYPRPINKLTRNYVQKLLLTEASYIKRHDPRLLIHLIAQVCLTNFGSDDFQRKFVCLDNMEHLARLHSLDFVSSRDIRILIEGLCKMTSRK